MHFSLAILYTISAEERWQRGKGPKKVLVLYGWYRTGAFSSDEESKLKMGHHTDFVQPETRG